MNSRGSTQLNLHSRGVSQLSSQNSKSRLATAFPDLAESVSSRHTRPSQNQPSLPPPSDGNLNSVSKAPSSNSVLSWSKIVQQHKPEQSNFSYSEIRVDQSPEGDNVVDNRTNKAAPPKLTKEYRNRPKAVRSTRDARFPVDLRPAFYPDQKSAPKKSVFNLSALLAAVDQDDSKRRKVDPKNTTDQSSGEKNAADLKRNDLDSSAPRKIRGKEREKPKVKRPSKLKQSILADREAKVAERRDRLMTDKTVFDAEILDETPVSVSVELHLTDGNDKNDEDGSANLEKSAFQYDFSKFLEAEPFIPAQNAETTPVKSLVKKKKKPSSSKPASRTSTKVTYSDYGRLPEVDILLAEILPTLVFYQDRAYKQDPVSFLRRIICGFHDVIKYLELNQVKIVIFAADIEKCPSLEERITKITELAAAGNVPIVFGLTRRLLARHCKKANTTSAVGVLNFDVANENVKKVLEIVNQRRKLILESGGDVRVEENPNFSENC